MVVAGLITALVGSGAVPAFACSAGPTAAPNAATDNLEDDKTHWGVYCPGTVNYAVNNITDASTAKMLLDLAATGGGDPYAYIHAYRHLLADNDANSFTMRVRFNYDPKGKPSAVHALQFALESWNTGKRYEFAVEWLNLGSGQSKWRYWTGSSWQDMGITTDLTTGTWHSLTVRGKIVSGKVEYGTFNINDQGFNLKKTHNGVTTSSSEPDRLAVTMTLVGDETMSPFNVYLDDMSLDRKVVGTKPAK